MKNIIKIARNRVRDLLVNKKKRAKLKNKNFTLISSDCTGGVVYHDLKERFNSPTINMYLDAPDYIKFISNIKYYLDVPMKELFEESALKGFPVAQLGDIKLYLVHYDNIAQAQEKWNQRKQRINWDNIFFIMNNRNFCTDKEIIQFNALVAKGKGVLFTNKISTDCLNVFYLKNEEQKQCVGIMTQYITLFRRRLDRFDWVDWINQTTKE